MKHSFHSFLVSASGKGRKLVALLIDPDSVNPGTGAMAADSGADLILIGGSLMSGGNMAETIRLVKKVCRVPVFIFPGSVLQICSEADGILNLSLISGRNPELLIGQHVIAAPVMKASGLEILPMGYMLIDSGKQTTASYMSGTAAIPYEKDEIAMCTAMAGEMLGLKTLYLDAGSGASKAVSASMVSLVKNNSLVPLFVGGGIRDSKTAVKLCKAGADVIVIGTGAEQDSSFAQRISKAVHSIK